MSILKKLLISVEVLFFIFLIISLPFIITFILTLPYVYFGNIAWNEAIDYGKGTFVILAMVIAIVSMLVEWIPWLFDSSRD